MTLTPRQLDVACAFRSFIILRGYSPTLQELADRLGTSKVTVMEHTRQLEAKGVIRRNPVHPWGARKLELVPGVKLEERSTKLPLLGTIE